jgi:hypothetical protein
MRRLALLAGPLFLVALIAGAAVVIHRRRASRVVPQLPRIDVSVPAEPRPATHAANAGAGVEVLAGYEERREEEEEARHGAVLHIEVGRLSVRQI